MEIEGTPRILVWLFSPHLQFLNPAMNVLERQFGKLEVLGITGEQQFDIVDSGGKKVPFIPLTAAIGNGGGVRHSPRCRRLRKNFFGRQTCKGIKY